MLDEIRGWGWLFVFIFNTIGLWGAWSLSRKFVTRDDYEKDKSQLQEKQSALTKAHDVVIASQTALATAISNLPTAKDVHTISLSIAEMRGDMKTLSEKMDGQAALQTRMENHLNLLMRGHMRAEQ